MHRFQWRFIKPQRYSVGLLNINDRAYSALNWPLRISTESIIVIPESVQLRCIFSMFIVAALPCIYHAPLHTSWLYPLLFVYEVRRSAVQYLASYDLHVNVIVILPTPKCLFVSKQDCTNDFFVCTGYRSQKRH